MVKTETLLDPKLATYRNLPVGSTVTPAISIPVHVGKGEPATCARAPVCESKVNTETAVETAFATKTNLPAGIFVFVANAVSTDVSVFTIDSKTGALAQVAG